MFSLPEQNEQVDDDFEELNLAFSCLVLQKGEISPSRQTFKVVDDTDDTEPLFGG